MFYIHLESMRINIIIVVFITVPPIFLTVNDDDCYLCYYLLIRFTN